MILDRFNTRFFQTLPAIFAFAILYILLAAEPLALDILPAFSVPRPIPEIIDESDTKPETPGTTPNNYSEDLFPFYNDTAYGFIGSKGELSFMSERQGTIAMTETMIVRRKNPQTPIEVILPSGKIEAQIQKSGLPFTSKGRVFVFRTDLSSLFELDHSGKILWEKEFSTILTACFVTSRYVVVGRLDGMVEVLDTEGKSKLILDPDTETDDPITGLAFDETNSSLIVTGGLTVQYVALFRLDQDEFKKIIKKVLPSARLNETACAFTPESGIVLVERDKSILITDVAKDMMETLHTNGSGSRFYQVFDAAGTLKGHSFIAGTTELFWLGTIGVHGRLLSMVPVIGDFPSIIEMRARLGLSTRRHVFTMTWEER